MAIVDKSYFLHERDEKGNLKPIVVEIEKGNEIKITPIPEGELGLLRDPVKGYEILSSHIIEPKISPDEFKKYGKTQKIAMILDKMLEISDAKRDNTPESFRDGSLG